eukprot:6291451-Alexandrium_andersonii.AAC.1
MLHVLGFSRPTRKGVCGLQIGGLRIGVRYVSMSRPRTPSINRFGGRFGISTNNGAECAPRELRGL